MKLDLREVLSGAVGELGISTTVDMTCPEVVDMIPDGVSFTSPLRVDGVVTDNAGYTRLSLDVEGDFTFSCDRCLAKSYDTVSFLYEKTVVREGVLENISEDEADEYIVAYDGFIDLDDILIEETMVSFPAKLVCSEDCLGLCHKCGKDLNEGPCGCSDKEIDPRLAPLAAILEKMKAEQGNEEN